MNSSQGITIAVTVFNRRTYLKQAIASALDQTVPARVLVVEDCGPDPGLRDFVAQEFGSRITYIRNARRRGLFGNWNACLEYCETPWLSLLHDDDFLSPRFVQTMVDLKSHAPDLGLYFGETDYVDENGKVVLPSSPWPVNEPWRRIGLADIIRNTPLPFPGHIFRADLAKNLGGFRESSQFCGDWEMWARLIAHYGAAQSPTTVAFKREHVTEGRGCTTIDFNGRLRPLVFVQQKRVLRMLRAAGENATFDRHHFLALAPMSTRYLLKHGYHLPPRILRYNVGLLLRSKPFNAKYAVFQAATRLFGVPFVRTLSRMREVIVKDTPDARRYTKESNASLKVTGQPAA